MTQNRPTPRPSKSSASQSDTTADLSSRAENTIFAEADTGELKALAQARKDLAIEANLILFSHPEDRMLGTRFRLAPHERLDVGRSSTCQIAMPGVRSLSRKHARLEHLGAVVVIEDLGSTNGTYVNDRRIDGRHRLRSGDRFQVGALHFKFLHERDPETAYHEAIYQLVMCDGLTRIFNKRKFDEEMRKEFERARRHNRPLSLIFFDLDHFKQINDTHGHLCGDFVLQQVARLVQTYLRSEQVFARVGGEEFVILSPEIGQGGAVQLSDKLRRRMEEERWNYGDVELKLTCSFGVAILDPLTMTAPRDLYQAADEAMYESKRAGRNRVTVYGSGGDAVDSEEPESVESSAGSKSDSSSDSALDVTSVSEEE